MPPPKKPKSGRTSLEQFLTDEEKVTQEMDTRLQGTETLRVRSNRDSEGNSPMGSLDMDGSDGEVFENSKHPRPRTDSDTKSSGDEQESLFNRLFRKSHSTDEQKVPGSPEQDNPSPTSSPLIMSDNDRISAFRLKYDEHVKYMSGKRGFDSSELYNSSRQSPQKQFDKLHAKGFDNRDGMNFRARTGSDPRHLSLEHSKLIDTLVASALASNAAKSIIYSSRPVNAHDMVGSNNSTSTNRISGYRVSSDMKPVYSDLEPHDLSKHSPMNNGLMNASYCSALNNAADRLHNPFEWAHRDRPEITVDRNKQYLDTHRHIVGLLSEREEAANTEKTASHVTEKENIVQNIPARYPNGLYHPSSLSLLGNYNRFDQRPRDSVKNDNSPNIVSHSGYLPLHSIMSHGPLQAPTSTTLDLVDGGDRFHPAFMNPGLMTDGRRVKQEHTHHHHGTSVNKLCQVCNDNASGFHYGVWSCEGCKAFFKRSIQGPVDYVCPATNTCTIDKHRRKSCQACRLRKCYEVGMNKGSQRKDRKAAGGGNKAPKRPRSESNEGTGISSSSSPTPVKNPRKSRTTLVLEALNKAELPSIESYHNHNVPPTRVHLLNSLVKLAERELVFLINWAKNVPGYTDLTLGDQVHLIECCWMELLLLNCAFRSIEHRGRSLVFAPDLVLDRPYWSLLGMCEILDQVSAVSEQMVRFDLHKEEMLLLQATVLANAEVRRLASYSKLHEIQHTILDSLVDIAQKYHPDNLRHIPSVLLLLTHIRQAAERATAFFQNIKKEGSVEFCDLLTEMLDAQSEDRKSSHHSSTDALTTPSPSSPTGTTLSSSVTALS